jgi:hypothetical protein
MGKELARSLEAEPVTTGRSREKKIERALNAAPAVNHLVRDGRLLRLACGQDAAHPVAAGRPDMWRNS